jgi:hypothetical protein
MRALILLLLAGPTLAETLILPTHPGTNTIDITQPGIRIEGDTIYETRPGPLGIINPMGTTYKREGNEYVPHKGILGPQNFDLPSYQIETDGGYGRPTGPIPIPVPQSRRNNDWHPQGLLPPPPVMPRRSTRYEDISEIKRLAAEVERGKRELQELREQRNNSSHFSEDDNPIDDCGIAFDEEGNQVSLCE